MTEFGTKMRIAGFSLRGYINDDHSRSIPDAILLAGDIVNAIGMTCSHEPQVTDYPAVGDKPSPGFLVLQPIIESAVLLDVWPRLGAMYVHVISCRDFNLGDLYPVFKRWGYHEISVFGGALEI